MSSSAEEAAVPVRDAGGQRRRMIMAAWLVAGFAGLLALLTVQVAQPARPFDSPLIGQAAPPFELTTLEGGRLSLAGLRGSAVVLNFWASWCIPCREEAPLLTDADARYGSQGVRIIGVVYQDSDDNARAFMRQYGQTYPSLIDPDGQTAIDYGVLGIPETFFIDSQGIVRSRQIGALTAGDLERQIRSVLP